MPMVENRKPAKVWKQKVEGQLAVPGGFNVIAVDDEPGMLKLLHAMLTRCGANEMHLCATWDDALVAMQFGRIDLVILDHRMPPENGVELARQLRRGETPLPKDTPIMLVTGHAERAVIAAARKAGINDILTKPIAIDRLSARIARLVPGARAADADAAAG
jgi:two-component system chemotaxis response regulator CheY